MLPWFALMLLVLVAMTGFGVDVWNWWYTGQQLQRGADAAALAGVPFMPPNFNGPAPSATSTAVDAAARNGIAITAANVAQGAKPNQLTVTISRTVQNSFTSLLGADKTTIARSATAEYNQPVQMASKDPFAGCDPENACTAKHWLNIGAPNIDKITGDRYADYRNCSASWRCSNGINTEYLDSYFFTIEVGPSAAGTSVDFQVYDPVYANGGTSCTLNWGPGSNGQRPNELVATYPDAAVRYMSGTSSLNNFCTGDDNTGLGTPQSTVWIARDADSLSSDPISHSVIQKGGPGPSGQCTKQFKGYNENFSDLLDPSPANPSGKYDADFAAAFHRWYTLCTVTGLKEGKYFIQVRSAVPLQANPTDANLTKPEVPTPEDPSIAGQNRYAIRVVNSGTSVLRTGVQVYASTHFPVYSNAGVNGVTPNFYLARLLPGGGPTGRVLQLRFFDIGDVGCVSGAPSGCGVTTVSVTAPAEMTLASGDSIRCSWSSNGGGPLPGGSVSGCRLSSITNAAFNGRMVEVNIAVPGSYNCNYVDPAGCWFRLQMSYTPGTQANDTTTWDATVGGDPVRLIK